MQQQQQGGLQSDYETEECEPEPEEELPDEVVDEQPDEELTLSLETDQPIVECGECVWIRGVQIVQNRILSGIRFWKWTMFDLQSKFQRAVLRFGFVESECDRCFTNGIHTPYSFYSFGMCRFSISAILKLWYQYRASYA